MSQPDPSPQSQETRLKIILYTLLIIIATLFLTQMLWEFFSGYADLILLFLLGWFVSFALDPLVTQLSHRLAPRPLQPLIESTLNETQARAVLAFRFSRGAAVAIVYLGLVVAIVIAAVLIVPPAIIQLSALATHLPEYATQVPQASAWVQNELARLGIRLNVEQAVQTGLGNLQNYAAEMIRNALGILSGFLNFFANLFLVLIISFLITLDGPRIRSVIFTNLVPPRLADEYDYFAESVERTFGGFIRGQLLQALLVAVGTAIGMTVLGLNFVLIASLFAGLFMLIPMVGPFLALVPPFLAGILQSPELTLWLTLALFIYQFTLTNVVMPRVLSDAVGLHPLLVFVALLFSIKVAGFWGAFFGIPIAGVIWAMGTNLFKQWRKKNPREKSP